MACSSGSDQPRVFAAASLTDVFDGLPAELVFAGSADLLRQLTDGARADALVTADGTTMAAAVTRGFVRNPVLFASNELVIVVEKGNPRGIRSLRDLRDLAGLRVALPGPDVPAGRYARAAFGLAGVEVPRASEETSVRAVRAKVALGEADAGVVYRTDVDDSVGSVEIPEQQQVGITYMAGAVTERGRPFVESLLSEPVRARLVSFGFLVPPR